MYAVFLFDSDQKRRPEPIRSSIIPTICVQPCRDEKNAREHNVFGSVDNCTTNRAFRCPVPAARGLDGSRSHRLMYHFYYIALDTQPKDTMRFHYGDFLTAEAATGADLGSCKGVGGTSAIG